MKKLMFVTVFILIGALSSFAQETPKYEISAGFSNLHESQIFQSRNFPGWYASISRNFTNWFAMEAEFSGHYSRLEEPDLIGFCISGCVGQPVLPITRNTRVQNSDHLFLTGPRFSYRGPHDVTFFAHGLIGARYTDNSTTFNLNSSGPQTFKFVHTSLAVGTGAGADIGITKGLAIRALQADYIHSGASFQDRNDLRLSSGLVFRFGSK